MKGMYIVVGVLVLLAMLSGGTNTVEKASEAESEAHSFAVSTPTATPSTYNNYTGEYDEPEDKTIDRVDAIYDHWDEIREYVNGSETIEACSSSSGNCYDLDADISSGSIEQIDFENGGYLYFSAEIDSDGNASDTDVRGDSWDFTVDMDSSMVDDAIQEWADYEGYEID